MEFGDILRSLRKEKGLTQAELAKAFSLGESTVSFYESNKRTPDYEILKKFADYFDVSVDYLLGRVEDRNAAILENIPKKLREVGIEYIEVDKTLKEKGLTPREVIELIEDLDKIGLLEKYQKK